VVEGQDQEPLHPPEVWTPSVILVPEGAPLVLVGNGEVVGENIQMTKGEFVEIVYPTGKQDVREYDCGVEKSDPTQQY
jgi:hypothetical protein